MSVPPPVPATNLSQQSVQRADAQSALTGVQTLEEYEGGGSVTTLSAQRSLYVLLKKVTAPMLELGGPRRVFTCNDGSGLNETIVTTGSTTATITIQDYYDSACTELESEVVWTATETESSSQIIVSGPAQFSEFAQGNSTTPTQTANAQITFYYTSSQELTGFSFLLSDLTNNGAPVSGEVGLACSSSTSTSVSCGVAAVANVAALNAEDGASVSAVVTESSSASVSMTISDYQGAENALAIAQGTFPIWNITPSSALVSSVSMTGQATSTGFTLTLTDSTNGGTFAITGSSSSVTGTLTATGSSTTVASFTINGQGNGTLTYSNGTQVQIVDYVVQG